MIEEVANHIYRIRIPMPGNPLRVLNSYFIRGGDRDLLVDVGFRCDEAKEALEAGLAELGADRSRIDVFCTHLHSDHCGNARRFAAPDGKIYMNGIDLSLLDRNLAMHPYHPNGARFLSEGFPEDQLTDFYETNAAFHRMLDRLDERFTPLSGGDVLEVGDYRLEVVCVPGHTPGNSMLWAEKQQIMFTGDHVLFDISPNITVWFDERDALGGYLDSLALAERYPVQLALPAHREGGDYHARIRELQRHHAERLDEVVSLIGENPGVNAYDLTGLMHWRIRARNWADFPASQRWFAVGECMAHLDHLVAEGRIRRVEEDGLRRYYL